MAAPTVPGMLFVALGLGVGLALALAARPLPLLISPIDAISSWLVALGHRLVTSAVRVVGLQPTDTATRVLAAVVAVMVPGLVCLALVWAAKAALGARRAVAVLLFAAALASFAVVPAAQAVLLCLLAVIVSAALALATGALLVAPVVAVATVLAARTVAVLLTGRAADVLGGAQALTAVSGIDPALWRVALTLVALVPIAGALRVLLRTR